MNIRIDNKGFTFGDHRFIYNLYFLDHDNEYDARTPARVFKKILAKWAEVLVKIDEKSSPMFLPFNPDDQWTDCLKADLIGTQLNFKFVRLADNGWGVFDFDIEDFITSGHKILKEDSGLVGRYEKSEVIRALLEAEVID